jgi:hypothetical protein
MTDQTNAEREDRVVLAFSPSDADHADDGYIWTLYNTALENPYSVANGDTKINNAVERINPNEYTLGENEHWVRFDWESVMNGDPQRLSPDGRSTDGTTKNASTTKQ